MLLPDPSAVVLDSSNERWWRGKVEVAVDGDSKEALGTFGLDKVPEMGNVFKNVFCEVDEGRCGRIDGTRGDCSAVMIRGE